MRADYECQLGRRGEAALRYPIEADRSRRNPAAGCAECRGGSSNPPPFSSQKRIFIAEKILHRSPYPVLRVRSEFQATGPIEAVHGVNQSDHAGTGQIVESDARRYAALEASRGTVPECVDRRHSSERAVTDRRVGRRTRPLALVRAKRGTLFPASWEPRGRPKLRRYTATFIAL